MIYITQDIKIRCTNCKLWVNKYREGKIGDSLVFICPKCLENKPCRGTRKKYSTL